MQHAEDVSGQTRGYESRERFRRTHRAAIVTILEQHGFGGTVDAETLSKAIVAQLVCESPRLKARARLIAEADGAPRCWICDLLIPMDAAEDTAECFSIDHVVPRSQGGTLMGYDNLRSAHRLCNAIRDLPKPSEKLLRHLIDMKCRLQSRSEFNDCFAFFSGNYSELGPAYRSASRHQLGLCKSCRNTMTRSSGSRSLASMSLRPSRSLVNLPPNAGGRFPKAYDT